MSCLLLYLATCFMHCCNQLSLDILNLHFLLKSDFFIFSTYVYVTRPSTVNEIICSWTFQLMAGHLTFHRWHGKFPHSAYYPPFRVNFPHFAFRKLPSAFRKAQFRILPTANFRNLFRSVVRLLVLRSSFECGPSCVRHNELCNINHMQLICYLLYI